jgi:hypothetical protein
MSRNRTAVGLALILFVGVGVFASSTQQREARRASRN